MNPTMEKIVWHQTLAFKLFLLVSLILFLSVGTISLQNSRQFRDILKRQNEDHLQVSAITTASSFQDNFDYWSALANSIGHMAASLPAEQLRSAAQGFLSSNHGLAAIHIIAARGNSSNETDIFLLTKSGPPQGGSQSFVGMDRQLIAQGRGFLRNNGTPAQQTRVFFKNLSSDLKIPVVQIATRLSRSMGSSAEKTSQTNDSWVILSLWRSAVTAAFQNSKILTSALMDARGEIVLQAEGDEKFELHAPIREKDLAVVDAGQVRSRTWLTQNKSGEPVIISANKLSDLNLFVVAQKLAKQDYEDIARQTKNTLFGSWILFLLALAACYFAAAGLTSRIIRLVQSTWQIAAGNLAIQLPEKNRDEVGLLARSVNRMASDIQGLLLVREVAARQQAELKMAENIQKMLIPEKHIKRNGIMTQSYFKPATECAGDWWGRFSLGPNKEIVVLADATGHGAHAAIIASLAYSYFATVTKQISDGKLQNLGAVKIVRELNSVLFSAGHGLSTMTMFMLLIDRETSKAEALSAGHCHPFILRGTSSTIIACQGGVLGVDEEISLESISIDLENRHRFLLYTDGLFECKNGADHFIKKKRFNERLALWNELPLEWIFKKITDLVDDHFIKSQLSDDITLVMIEYEDGSIKPKKQDVPEEKKEVIDRIDSDSQTWIL